MAQENEVEINETNPISGLLSRTERQRRCVQRIAREDFSCPIEMIRALLKESDAYRPWVRNCVERKQGVVKIRQHRPCEHDCYCSTERTRSPAALGRLQLEAGFLHINYETRSSRAGKRAYRQGVQSLRLITHFVGVQQSHLASRGY